MNHPKSRKQCIPGQSFVTRAVSLPPREGPCPRCVVCHLCVAWGCSRALL